MAMSERQIKYVLYPFQEEEEIYFVGKSMIVPTNGYISNVNIRISLECLNSNSSS